MNLMVNGEQRALTPPAETVDGVISTLGLPKERVAVELNGTVVMKGARASTAVKDGDVLEVVTLVGGG